MSLLNIFQKKSDTFLLSQPPIAITKNYLSLQAELQKENIACRRICDGYISFSAKIPDYDAQIEIGVHSLGPVVTFIEIWRPMEVYQSPDFDLYQSYRDFSCMLEHRYGKPFIRVPKNFYGDGEISEEWVKPFKIRHYIMERFGLEEHLRISF